MDDALREPTADECAEEAKIFETQHTVGYAMWYPQMSGYVGKCVVVLSKDGEEDCFEAYVWHNGSFPFEGGPPTHIHHCDPDQFIEFGETVAKLEKKENSS